MNSSWSSASTIALGILLQIFTGAPEAIGSFNVEPRIIHGLEADLKSTAHMVSIRIKTFNTMFFGAGHKAGGSLITNSVVLTAAHSFYIFNTWTNLAEFRDADDYTVVMGTLVLDVATENTLSYDLKGIFVDVEKYNHTTHEADIALAFLRGSVPANHPVVKPISINRKTIPDGTMCQVFGWGTTELNKTSNVLLTTDVPLISKDLCANTTKHNKGELLDGMMCAGYLEGGRDSCFGDSGGLALFHLV